MYWDPWDELERMHENMDRLFRSFWTEEKPMIGYKGKHPMQKTARMPQYHLHETENSIIASIEIPGVSKGDIDLRVEDDHLSLKVESRKEKKEEKDGGYSIATQRHSYFRSIPLPREVDSDLAKAEYKDGVLRVEIPKKHEKKGKKIDVK